MATRMSEAAPSLMVKALNWISTMKPDERADGGERQRLGGRDLARRNGPARRARGLRVVVAVDVVVVGAARRAHGERADREQREQPRVGVGRSSATSARPTDHQHGSSSSHKPIGRSRRASRR